MKIVHSLRITIPPNIPSRQDISVLSRILIDKYYICRELDIKICQRDLTLRSLHYLKK